MLTDFGFDPIDTPIKPMSTERCEGEALAALKQDRATHIAGRTNRIMAALSPRRMATGMYGAMAAHVLARRGAQAVEPPQSSDPTAGLA